MDLTRRPIDDDDVLSQVGVRKRNGTLSFHNAPRPFREPAEVALSWVLGALTPHEARLACFGPDTRLHESDAVRHVTVGCLRSAGFSVDHDPPPHEPGPRPRALGG